MAKVVIRVGAALDANLATVFRPIVDAARRARGQIQRDMNVPFAGPYRTNARAAGDALKGVSETSSKISKEMERDVARSAKERVRTEKEAMREVERDLAAHNRERERLDREADNEAKKRAKDRSRFLGGMFGTRGGLAGVAGSALRTGATMAKDMALDFARGAGFNWDLGSYVQKNADLETAAVQVSNSGYMPGAQGANGQRVSSSAIIKDVRDAANETAMSTDDAMAGLQAFVGKTGDLETGRKVLKDLAMLSKATGTSLEDMVDAAGDVSNQLGDTANKGEAINFVMRSAAGQGKLGAVEIKDLAQQMAKVAASANQIEGDPAQNMILLGAFAQEARQRGGAASAPEAATAVQGLINTLKTPARVGQFKQAGINVFTKGGQIRNPEEILIQALQKKGRDPVAFKKLFANVSGGRAVEGFASIYRKAYNESTGKDDAAKTADATKAVRDEFDRLKNSVMSQNEIQTSFSAAMNTTQSQTQLFNNKMQETTQQMQDALLPALIALSPVIISTTKAMADWMTKIFGGSGVNDSAAFKSGLDASKEITASDSQARAGILYDKQLDANAATIKALETQVDQQSVDVMNNRDVSGNILDNTVGGLGALMSGGSFADYEKLKTDQATGREEELSQNKEKLEALKAQQKRLTDGILDGTIKVKVVNMPLPSSGGPPPLPVNTPVGVN
jgi:hypothetical protein